MGFAAGFRAGYDAVTDMDEKARKKRARDEIAGLDVTGLSDLEAAGQRALIADKYGLNDLGRNYRLDSSTLATQALNRRLAESQEGRAADLHTGALSLQQEQIDAANLANQKNRGTLAADILYAGLRNEDLRAGTEGKRLNNQYERRTMDNRVLATGLANDYASARIEGQELDNQFNWETFGTRKEALGLGLQQDRQAVDAGELALAASRRADRNATLMTAAMAGDGAALDELVRGGMSVYNDPNFPDDNHAIVQDAEGRLYFQPDDGGPPVPVQRYFANLPQEERSALLQYAVAYNEAAATGSYDPIYKLRAAEADMTKALRTGDGTTSKAFKELSEHMGRLETQANNLRTFLQSATPGTPEYQVAAQQLTAVMQDQNSTRAKLQNVQGLAPGQSYLDRAMKKDIPDKTTDSSGGLKATPKGDISKFTTLAPSGDNMAAIEGAIGTWHKQGFDVMPFLQELQTSGLTRSQLNKVDAWMKQYGKQ